ncbi:hypothetical protein [Thermococcus sp. 9N3]|uniref:hypothetical protein n=1 Tax=Thermococcus sp. 9N3 TaxID=163002 RepID=UPI0014317EE5|nr:hypothetical protein [Thermococcus sp. 9N3]NJE49574.1 hypothetical protein [Thermococcus sp. 9N3]
MEELSEALKAIERELNFARKAYNSIVYLYWAVAFPVVYLTSSILSACTGASANSLVVIFSALAILLFVFEELKASKKVRGIEKALGRKTPLNRRYLLAQALIWPVVIVIAGVLVEDVWLSSLLVIGSGMLALAVVDYAFLRGGWDKAIVGATILLLSVPYGRVSITKGAYATLVLSLAFALGAYLVLRKAMRE